MSPMKPKLTGEHFLYQHKRWMTDTERSSRMISRALRAFLALAVLLCQPILTPTVEAQQDNKGFLYGRVVTNSGTEYEGFLR